jgi:hypothetical protein
MKGTSINYWNLFTILWESSLPLFFSSLLPSPLLPSPLFSPLLSSPLLSSLFVLFKKLEILCSWAHLKGPYF